MLRLMVVTAHPDDEAGAFGGTLRLYADRGVETCALCLTPGQAASHRSNAKTDQQLAAVRRKEFAASCAILGVARPIVLDYMDGRLHRLDLYQVVWEITRQIRSFRPHVLVTFGSEGAITSHPDHSMASVFTTLAFQWAGRTNRYPDQLQNGLAPHRTQKLYYGTVNFTLPDRQPIALAPITAVIEFGKHLETKIAAFHAHQTQAPLFPIFENTVRQQGARESFHLAASVNPGPILQETDLFEGITKEGQSVPSTRTKV
jgi:LmbE family N-acetylglucosaminyl deacetylase